jgi:hypothetical protein
MIEYIFYWASIGFVLCLQHSYRFYIKNKGPLNMESYLDEFAGTKRYYFACLFLWLPNIDFLADVEDHNRVSK